MINEEPLNKKTNEGCEGYDIKPNNLVGGRVSSNWKDWSSELELENVKPYRYNITKYSAFTRTSSRVFVYKCARLFCQLFLIHMYCNILNDMREFILLQMLFFHF